MNENSIVFSTKFTQSIYRKYERTKEAISGFQENEDALKITVQDLGGKLKKAEDRYDLLKSHAESKLGQ